MELEGQENFMVSQSPKNKIGFQAARSPCKNIHNTIREVSLDDSEDWRDRVEVITKDVHDNYVSWSREAISDLIDSAIAKSQQNKKQKEEPPIITLEDEEDEIAAIQTQAMFDLPSGSLINSQLEENFSDADSDASDDSFLQEGNHTIEEMNSSILGMLSKFKNMNMGNNDSISEQVLIEETGDNTETNNTTCTIENETSINSEVRSPQTQENDQTDPTVMDLEEIDEKQNASSISFVSDFSHAQAEQIESTQEEFVSQLENVEPSPRKADSTFSSILDQMGGMKITPDQIPCEISDDEFEEAREELDNSMVVNRSDMRENPSTTIILDHSTAKETESGHNSSIHSEPLDEDAESEESFISLTGELDKSHHEPVCYDVDITLNESKSHNRSDNQISANTVETLEQLDHEKDASLESSLEKKQSIISSEDEPFQDVMSSGSVDESSSHQFVAESSANVSVAESSTIQSVEETSAIRSVGESSMNLSVVEQTTIEPIAEPSATGSVVEPSATGSVAEPSAIEPVAEPSALQPVSEPSAIGSIDGSSTVASVVETVDESDISGSGAEQSAIVFPKSSAVKTVDESSMNVSDTEQSASESPSVSSTVGAIETVDEPSAIGYAADASLNLSVPESSSIRSIVESMDESSAVESPEEPSTMGPVADTINNEETLPIESGDQPTIEVSAVRELSIDEITESDYVEEFSTDEAENSKQSFSESPQEIKSTGSITLQDQTKMETEMVESLPMTEEHEGNVISLSEPSDIEKMDDISPIESVVDTKDVTLDPTVTCNMNEPKNKSESSGFEEKTTYSEVEAESETLSGEEVSEKSQDMNITLSPKYENVIDSNEEQQGIVEQDSSKGAPDILNKSMDILEVPMDDGSIKEINVLVAEESELPGQEQDINLDSESALPEGSWLTGPTDSLQELEIPDAPKETLAVTQDGLNSGSSSSRSDSSCSDDEANRTVIEQTEEIINHISNTPVSAPSRNLNATSTPETSKLNDSDIQNSSACSSTPKSPKSNTSFKNQLTPISVGKINTSGRALAPKTLNLSYQSPQVSQPRDSPVTPPMSFSSKSPSTPEDIMSIAEEQARELSNTGIWKSPIPPPEQFLNDTLELLAPITEESPKDVQDKEEEIAKPPTDGQVSQKTDSDLRNSQTNLKIPPVSCGMTDEDFFGPAKVFTEDEFLQDRFDNASHDPRKSISSLEFDLINQQALKMAESQATAAPPPPIWDRTLPSMTTTESISETKEESAESFIDASQFFQSEGLDMLESRAARVSQRNLPRDSLFIKFDPLLSNRESLAPLIEIPKPEDSRRVSALMQFSPRSKSESVLEDTLVRLDDTVMIREKSSTPVSVEDIYTQTEESVITISEMKNTLQTVELEHQDTLLRKTREIIQEYEAALQKNKDEIEEYKYHYNVLRSVGDSMKEMIFMMKKKKDDVERELQSKIESQLVQLNELKSLHEVEMEKAQKEIQEKDTELTNMETSLLHMAKRCERMKEVFAVQQRNETALKESNEELLKKMAEDKRNVKEKFMSFQEHLKKVCDENDELMKEKENDAKRSMIMMKKAELKIIRQSEIIENQEKELRRLQDALDCLNV